MNGQGGWTGAPEILVSPDVPYEGAKGLKVTGVGSYTVSKTVPLRQSSQLSFMLRRDVALGSAYHCVYIPDTDTQIIAEIGLLGSNIKYTSNGALVTLLSGCTLATWYKVDILFRCAPDYKCKYRVNDGTWTDWVTRANAASNKPSSVVTLEFTGLSGGGIHYMDDIKSV